MSKLLTERLTRHCPVCDQWSDANPTVVAENIDIGKMSSTSFASRKEPEFMNYRLVRCIHCATVFAPEVPKSDAIIDAYHQADYDSAVEAGQAADSYAKALAPHLAGLKRRAALEVGTGSGAFLAHLLAHGFVNVIGIEPSLSAINAAVPSVLPLIREGVFNDSDFAPGTFDLICCFMTFEHVPMPRQLMDGFYRALAPGGKVAIVVHDYSAPLNRVLGKRSPIVDIEHLQLFCPQSVETLFTLSGLVPAAIRPFTNAYRLGYWLRLLPLPQSVRKLVVSVMSMLRLTEILVPMNVGNLFCVATKPE